MCIFKLRSRNSESVAICRYLSTWGRVPTKPYRWSMCYFNDITVDNSKMKHLTLSDRCIWALKLALKQKKKVHSKHGANCTNTLKDLCADTIYTQSLRGIVIIIYLLNIWASKTLLMDPMLVCHLKNPAPRLQSRRSNWPSLRRFQAWFVANKVLSFHRYDSVITRNECLSEAWNTSVLCTSVTSTSDR